MTARSLIATLEKRGIKHTAVVEKRGYRFTDTTVTYEGEEGITFEFVFEEANGFNAHHTDSVEFALTTPRTLKTEDGRELPKRNPVTFEGTRELSKEQLDRINYTVKLAKEALKTDGIFRGKTRKV